MEITITRARAEDALEILELSKILGGETDNLSFGSAGIPVSEQQEREYLSAMAESERDLFLTARMDGALVGTANYTTFSRRRMAHRGEIGMAIRKSAWGLGIGSILMTQLLDFAKNTAKAEIVSLEVRSDNQRAIHLYQKFGFETVGRFRGYFKINGEWIDFDLMEKLL